MPEPWQPGDLALCVDLRPEQQSPWKPGAIYTVTGIGRFPHNDSRRRVGLRFREIGAAEGEWHNAYFFRRIAPYQPTLDDQHVAHRLRAGRPIHEVSR